jgi:predicted Zn-dependent protease
MEQKQLDTNVKKAQTLMQDIKKKIANWNERSSFTLKGVKNLSKGDLEMIEFYAQNIIRNGGELPSNFSPLYGRKKEVMVAYEICLD